MPDHLHLLIEGLSDDSDCKAFEHVLRDKEVTLDVARYTLANPVRAGLSRTVDEYPFVGSVVYESKDLIASTSS